MLNEASIKVAVIDRLYKLGALNDAVLINEMVVANWSRRADLAVANGKLHAFEIKSDLDTLKRLEGQVGTYLGRFDKVTVVTTSRYLNAIKQIVPSDVELWEVIESEQKIVIRVAQRGKTKEIKNKRLLCGFLHKPELVSFLKNNDVAAYVGLPRESLINAIESISVTKLREFVLNTLKFRYKDSFNFFENMRGETTSVSQLNFLSRSKLSDKNLTETPAEAYSTHEAKCAGRELDLEFLKSKYGRLPDNMPISVLPRKPKLA